MCGAEDVEAEKYRCERHEESVACSFVMDMGGEVKKREDGECAGHVDGVKPPGYS